MSLNVVKKGVLGKDKFFYQAIELLLQPEDRDAGDESEAKLREMLKENLQAQHKHKASAGPGRPATAAASRPGQEKPSFMRSFSREERGQAKQSHLLQAKLKPQATLWTPSTSLASPSWMKTVKREGGGLVKHEAEQIEEEVVESRDSPEEDDRAKRKYADYQQQQQQQAQYGAEEGQAAGGSFPPGSPAFSSPGNDPAGSSPPSSPPTASMPLNKKAMLGKSAEGMVHALHNRDLKIKKKLKEVKKAREARSVRPTFNK